MNRQTLFDSNSYLKGLVAVYRHSDARELACNGLRSLSHRGGGCAEVLSFQGNRILTDSLKSMPLKSITPRGKILPDEFEFGAGDSAFGFISTDSTQSGQPFFITNDNLQLSILMDGKILNREALAHEMVSLGKAVATSLDAEVVAGLIGATSDSVLEAERVISVFSRLKGAFSSVVMFQGRLYAVRDPQGIRSISIGRLQDSFILATESLVFDSLGAEYLRELQPGEVIEIAAGEEMKSYFPFNVVKESICVREALEYSANSSYFSGSDVYSIKRELGARHADRDETEVDLVSFISRVDLPGVFGYADRSGISLEEVLEVDSDSSVHDLQAAVHRKHLRMKKVLLVVNRLYGDSFLGRIVDLLRQAGAVQVHLRVLSPYYTQNCCYAGNSEEQRERKTEGELLRSFRLDSIAFSTSEDIADIFGSSPDRLCSCCRGGEVEPPVGGEDASQGELF